MNGSTRWTVPLLSLALCVPGVTAQDKRDDKKSGEATTSQKKHAADKLIFAGQMVGRVVEWSPEYKVLVLDVKLRIPDGVDEGVANNIASKQAEIVKASAIRDPVQRTKRVAELQLRIAELLPAV